MPTSFHDYTMEWSSKSSCRLPIYIVLGSITSSTHFIW